MHTSAYHAFCHCQQGQLHCTPEGAPSPRPTWGRRQRAVPGPRRRENREESAHTLLTCAGAGPCRCAHRRHGATRQRRDHWHVHGTLHGHGTTSSPSATRPMCSCSDLRSRCSYKKQSTESRVWCCVLMINPFLCLINYISNRRLPDAKGIITYP